METKIKEVQDYFVNKIVKGEYTLERVSHPTATIIIDDRYHFNLWISNGAKYFETYDPYFNFIPIEFTDKEKEIALSVFKDKVREDLEARTIAEIQELENKIENLKKSL